jgi:uncharacterized protein (TIGR02996 family)
MTEDAALFAAALANPFDETPRLVLADWLDEHDEEVLARSLRSVPEIIPFLADLVDWGVSPSRPIWSFANRYPEERWDVLPAAQLLLRYRNQFPAPPDVPEKFEPAAKPSDNPRAPIGPGQFLDRWQLARRRQVDQLRERAARAGARRMLPAAEFAGPCTDPEMFEYRCCLLQELVVNGHEPASIAGIDRHCASMRQRGHPLTKLPLRPLDVESELARWLPRYGDEPDAIERDLPQIGEGLPVWPGAARTPAIVASRADPGSESEACKAIRGWIDQSNGRVETCEFRFGQPLRELTLDAFESFGIASLASSPALRLRVQRIRDRTALETLFSAACNGGAYGRREWGAYGRLCAWQSFAWLAGAVAGADLATVEEAAARCHWFSYAGTDWFMDIAWDLGLVAIRPDGLSAAVLAATDTD